MCYSANTFEPRAFGTPIVKCPEIRMFVRTEVRLYCRQEIMSLKYMDVIFVSTIFKDSSTLLRSPTCKAFSGYMINFTGMKKIFFVKHEDYVLKINSNSLKFGKYLVSAYLAFINPKCFF